MWFEIRILASFSVLKNSLLIAKSSISIRDLFILIIFLPGCLDNGSQKAPEAFIKHN